MITKDYRKGLHILAEIKTDDVSRLSDAGPFIQYVHEHIVKLGLNQLGHVKHNFEGGGFTAVVCLTESHLSVHTWPEFGIITTDVYLSNFLNDNADACRKLYVFIKQYFGGDEINLQEVWR